MKGKTLSSRFWLILLGGIAALSAAAAAILFLRAPTGTVANLYLNGECIESVDLSAVTEPYTIPVTGTGGITDLVEVAPGRIRVKEADCPDQVCVQQGWIETGVAPVVCLPNALVIQIEDAPGSEPDVDAVVR